LTVENIEIHFFIDIRSISKIILLVKVSSNRCKNSSGPYIYPYFDGNYFGQVMPLLLKDYVESNCYNSTLIRDTINFAFQLREKARFENLKNILQLELVNYQMLG
jgi:hypothetical protein